jgi:hypothetical protein
MLHKHAVCFEQLVFRTSHHSVADVTCTVKAASKLTVGYRVRVLCFWTEIEVENSEEKWSAPLLHLAARPEHNSGFPASAERPWNMHHLIRTSLVFTSNFHQSFKNNAGVLKNWKKMYTAQLHLFRRQWTCCRSSSWRKKANVCSVPHDCQTVGHLVSKPMSAVYLLTTVRRSVIWSASQCLQCISRLSDGRSSGQQANVCSIPHDCQTVGRLVSKPMSAVYLMTVRRSVFWSAVWIPLSWRY